MKTRPPRGTNLSDFFGYDLADCVGHFAVVAPPKQFDDAQTRMSDGTKAPEALRRHRGVRILKLVNNTVLATVLVKTLDTMEFFIVSLGSLKAP